MFILYICFLVYKWKKLSFDIKQFGFKFLFSEIITIDNLIYLISVIIFIIFVLFSKYYDHDATYYLNISSNFANGIYSTNGLNTSLSKYYLEPTMYYVYGSIFNGYINESYYLMNPIFTFIICQSILTNLIDYFKINNKKWKPLFVLVFNVSFVFLILSQLSYIPEMNTIIQSTILLICLFSIKNNSDNYNLYFLPLISICFFSSTGLLLNLVAICVMFVYLFFTKSYKKVMTYIPLVLLIIIYSFCTFVQSINFDNSIAIKLIFIIVSFALILVFVILKFIFRKKIITNDKSIFDRFNTNKITYISFNLLYLITIIFQLIFFIKIYELNHWKEWTIYISFAINLLIFLYSFLYSLKKKTTNSFIVFIFLLLLFSTLVLLIQKNIPSFASNASAWRLIWLQLGMGFTSDIVIQIIFLLNILIITLNNIINFENLKLRKIFSPIISLIFFLVSIFSFVNSYSNLFNNDQIIKLDKNVSVNMNSLTNNDIELLKSLSSGNYQKSYFSDMPIQPFMNQYCEVTSYFYVNQNNNPIQGSYKWNYRCNLLDGLILLSNDNNNVNNLPINNTSLEELFKNMINNFEKYVVKTYKNQDLNKIDYIVLNKNTSYFNSFNNILSGANYKILSNGDNICIYSL